MQLKTILNRIQKFNCFVYGSVRWVEDAQEPTIEADLRPRANSRPICAGCGHKRPGYDRLPTRRFEFVPMWGIKVFFRYAPRRVDCPSCGIRVERMPWSEGKHRLTETYAWFLAGWARRLSWKEVAEAFRTSWDHVFCSVEMSVTWGRAHRDLSGIEAIGLDEIQWLVEAGVQLILVPKVEDPDEVRAVHDRVRQAIDGRKHDVWLMPIVESALGVIRAYEIARSVPSVAALTIGLEDYTADLGTQRTNEGRESFWARSQVVNAARAAGVQAIDTVFSDVGDSEGLRASVLEAKGLGFEGKGCIHPRQIRVIHEAFVQ